MFCNDREKAKRKFAPNTIKLEALKRPNHDKTLKKLAPNSTEKGVVFKNTAKIHGSILKPKKLDRYKV